MQKITTLALVPQGSLHRYWKSLHAGALKSVHDLHAEGYSLRLEMKAPVREDDRVEQSSIFENFVRRGVQGLVLAPFDSDGLVGPVDNAAHLGIPTVIVDSSLNTRNLVSFIATDNKRAGMLAANRMAELLSGAGKVLVLRYQKGSASTEEREKGFVQQLRSSSPAVEIILSEEFAGATRDTARATSQNLLNRLGKDLRGVFTPNESSTAGMLMALQAAGLSGKLVVVGFDASDVYLDSLRTGRLQGLAVQNPFRMGELAVTTLVDHLQGKSVPKYIDTGVTVVTPENFDAPAIQALVNPSSLQVSIRG